MSQTAVCNAFDAYLAIEVGNILGTTERAITESSHPAMRIIRDAGSADLTVGLGARKTRMSMAPTAASSYTNILNNGHGQVKMEGRGCDGKNEEFDVKGNKKGNCGLPIGKPLAMGEDEFSREVLGLAHMTEPFCAWDYAQFGEDRVRMFMAALRKGLSIQGRDAFELSLEEQLLSLGESSLSFYSAQDLNVSKGGFNQLPISYPTIPHLKRHARILRRNGWPKGDKIIYYMSREVVERMIQSHKAFNNVEITTTPRRDDNISLNGMDGVSYEGLTFVFPEDPIRMTAAKTGPGMLELNRIYPTLSRPGTGGGLVWDVNPDFDKCFLRCNGKRSEVYEVGLFGHSTAISRQTVQTVTLPGQGRSIGSNFDLQRIDGADLIPYVDCNIGNHQFALYMEHRYLIEPENPELAGGFLFRYAPESLYLDIPSCDGCDEGCPGCDEDCTPNTCPLDPEDVTVTLAGQCLPIEHACSGGTPGCCEEVEKIVTHRENPERTVDACGADGLSCEIKPIEIQFSEVAIESDNCQTEVCLYVERLGDCSDPISVKLDTVAGTGISGVDFVPLTPGFSIEWAAMDNNPKRVCVSILKDGAGGSFSIDLSNPSLGALVAGRESATINLDDCCGPAAPAKLILEGGAPIAG